MLVVKNCSRAKYLGMRIVSAKAPFNGFLRPIINLPFQLRQVLDLDGDVYVLRNPDMIPLAFALRVFGKQVIYDTQEDFSKRPLIRDVLPVWLRPAVAWLITRLEKLLARTTSVIVTQTQQLVSLGGRTMYQPNAPLVSGPILERSKVPDFIKQDNELVFVYAGEIARGRGLFAMLDVVHRVASKHRVRLDLVGPAYSDELILQAKRHPGWRYVRYHGEKSHASALRTIRQADIGLALLQPLADYPTSSITKLYEYMQFGVPFIASHFDAWKVDTQLGAPGLYVNPDSAFEIANAGLTLASNQSLRSRMGRAGLHFVESEFNWERVSKPFHELVGELTSNAMASRKT